MKKILLVLGVVGMLSCQTVCYAEPEPLTTEVSQLSMLDDYGILEYMFIGKSLLVVPDTLYAKPISLILI